MVRGRTQPHCEVTHEKGLKKTKPKITFSSLTVSTLFICLFLLCSCFFYSCFFSSFVVFVLSSAVISVIVFTVAIGVLRVPGADSLVSLITLSFPTMKYFGLAEKSFCSCGGILHLPIHLHNIRY